MGLDCFVAALLAMTILGIAVIASPAKPEKQSRLALAISAVS